MVSISSHESRFYNYNDKFSIPAGLIVHPASRPYDASVINRGHQERFQDFKLGGAHLKKMHRAEGGAKIFGVFRVKNHDFTPKNQIFSNFRGGGAGCAPPPGSAPGHDHFHSLGLFSIKCNLIFSTCALYIAGFFSV